MKAETPYIHLHERKRTLDSVEVICRFTADGGEEVIQRALALRGVLKSLWGDFIADAMKGDLPDVKGCRELLESNVKTKLIMILHLTSRPRRIKSPIGLRQKLSVLRMRGWNSTAIQSLKPWYLKDPSSLSYSPSSDSLETPDCAPQARTSHETSRPTSPPTRSSVKSSVLSLTKSSISLGELRLLGCFNPSKGKTLRSISRQTSGWQVQIACTPVEKPKG